VRFDVQYFVSKNAANISCLLTTKRNDTTIMANSNDTIRHEENGVEYFTIVATGESGMSYRGIESACGKSRGWIGYIVKALEKNESIKGLEHWRGKALTLEKNTTKNGKPVKIPLADFCSDVITEQAFQGNLTAQAIARASNRIGLTSFIQAKTGWLPTQYQSSQEARVTINRVMDKPRRFHALFGDDKMDVIASFLKVGRNHPKLANWMWTFIYHTFSAEERASLDRNNPIQPNGHRKQTIHQWLELNSTEQHKAHFDKVLLIVDSCPSEQEFNDLYARLVNRQFQQRLLG
jgi:hypothetical protein